MITRNSIPLEGILGACYALEEGTVKRCRVMDGLHEECGTCGCPWYKPKDCRDWVRVEDDRGVSVVPPEEYRAVRCMSTDRKGQEYFRIIRARSAEQR